MVSGPSTNASQFSNAAVNNTTFTPAGGAGTYTLRWTITHAPCSSSTDNVVVTVSGPFQAAEVIAILERQREDGTWTYGTLLDTRAMHGRPTIADMREFMKLDARTHADLGPRGPLALLATDSAMYAAACVYAAIGRARRTVEAFRDYAEHLKSGGILTITRWFSSPPDQVLRLVTLTRAMMTELALPDAAGLRAHGLDDDRGAGAHLLGHGFEPVALLLQEIANGLGARLGPAAGALHSS